MAKDNTKPKAETKPEDEQNSVQQATEDEQNAPSNVDDTTSHVEGEAKGGTEEPSDVPVKLAVISARGLALREKPGKEHAMLAVLPTGTALIGRASEENSEAWIAVQTNDGKEGWVDTRFVTVVD